MIGHILQGIAGRKDDAHKPPVARGCIHAFPRALSAVSEVSAAGARKYTWDGWRSVDDAATRYADAQMRHELAIARGELIDPETGYPHLAHIAWNALARLELSMVAAEGLS